MTNWKEGSRRIMVCGKLLTACGWSLFMLFLVGSCAGGAKGVGAEVKDFSFLLSGLGAVIYSVGWILEGFSQ